MKILNIVFIAMSLAFLGCSLDAPSKEATVLDTGDANFASYVALGNSLTAGYQSGALTEKHQKYSYVNFIAQQAAVQTFQQPLLGYPGIGDATSGILELIYLDNPERPGAPLLTAAPYADHPDFNPGAPYVSADVMNHPAPYNNLGVPGALLVDLLQATDAASSASGSNSMFDIILRNANPAFGNTTAVQQAGLLTPTPTFMTCWIGNNDVLGYATSGGTFPPTPTPGGAFGALYGQLLDALVATGADIVVANIPDVTTIPFFTAVPYKIDPGIGTEVPLGISTNDGPRAATEGDFILLTGSGLIGDVSGNYGYPAGLPIGLHPDAPMPNSVVLDSDEIAVAQAAVTDFNSQIASLAAARDIVVVDINGIFNDIHQNGYDIAGLTFTTSFITGGLFSLDGVHPSDLGAAIVANQFISAINDKYNATIPFVNVIDLMEEISLKKTSAQATYNKETFDNVVKMFSGR